MNVIQRAFAQNVSCKLRDELVAMRVVRGRKCVHSSMYCVRASLEYERARAVLRRKTSHWTNTRVYAALNARCPIDLSASVYVRKRIAQTLDAHR